MIRYGGNASYHNGKHGFIFSRGCTHNLLVGNIAYGNGGHGFMIDDGRSLSTDTAQTRINGSDDNLLLHNFSAANAGNGVEVEGGTGNLVDGNRVNQNYVGVRVKDGASASVRDNTMADNLRYGVDIRDGDGTVDVAGNAISASWGAINLATDASATLSENSTDDVSASLVVAGAAVRETTWFDTLTAVLRWNPMLVLWSVLVGILAAVGACSALPWTDRTANGSTAQQSISPNSGLPVDTAVSCPAATVAVETSGQLTAALGAVGPGTVIALADGTYDGEFTAGGHGTAAAPIWLCGSANAILRGRGVTEGAVLHLQQAAYWRLVGFTVRDGQKGVLVDGVTDSILEDLAVTEIGDEGVHLRSGSSANVLRGLTVSRTGLSKEQFGEGIYVGTSRNNWCQVSGCEPDRSDRNVIVGSTISGTTAESIDIKEGTTGGVVKGSTFDGAELRGDADSWVNVKGNGWLIKDNVGTTASGSGFEVHQILDGWGTGNVFDANTADVRGAGYGFEFRPVADNRVTCTNTVVNAARGFANTSCG